MTLEEFRLWMEADALVPGEGKAASPGADCDPAWATEQRPGGRCDWDAPSNPMGSPAHAPTCQRVLTGRTTRPPSEGRAGTSLLDVAEGRACGGMMVVVTRHV
jgi:hypothetical protein